MDTFQGMNTAGLIKLSDIVGDSANTNTDGGNDTPRPSPDVPFRPRRYPYLRRL